ncbi:type II secretion system major pseudopilin GspG [Serratia quinivorans]|uniref:type II secretion system major pseudopilin GspG n=1 Tax=Serratia quinivorans TaxID=137545 RepID=UPI002179163B|nr:type II secretion system major pseudopilin GspG [Serratia quinivorans]CAI1114271.1 Cholera toxin secretion protein epsG [Serratia quinivorans]CAI1875881.1 Cholera toxin secretion protein epsG [Serratia quinivorans]
MKKIRRPVGSRGFTLLEMMIVIMIIGMLATLIVPNIMQSKDRANSKKVLSDLISLESALDMYYMDNGSYPPQDVGLLALIASDGGGYIKRLPLDPWRNKYRYSYPGEHGVVDIYSFGSDGKEGGEDSAADIGNWNVNDY